jgi:hypothetical protein
LRASLLLSLVTSSRNTETKLGATVRRLAETRRSPVDPPQQKGFGSTLPEQLIQRDLGEAPRLTFEADGFIYELNVLLAALEASASDGDREGCGLQPREHGQPAHVESVEAAPHATQRHPRGRRVSTPKCRGPRSAPRRPMTGSCDANKSRQTAGSERERVARGMARLGRFPSTRARKRQSYPQKGWVVVGTPGGTAGFTWAAPFPIPPLIGADRPLAFGHP